MSRTTIYELAVLYRSDLEPELDKTGAKTKKLITDTGGIILKEEVWGKRQLAYIIQKQTHALYIFYDLELEGSQLAKIEAALNIDEGILRYQFHKPDLKALAAALAQASAEQADKQPAEVGKKESKKEAADVAQS